MPYSIYEISNDIKKCHDVSAAFVKVNSHTSLVRVQRGTTYMGKIWYKLVQCVWGKFGSSCQNYKYTYSLRKQIYC